MKKKLNSMWRVGLALVLALSLSWVMAVPVAAADLTSVTAVPADATETAVTTYTIGFTTAQTWGIATVDIVFTGFSGSATLGEVTGIGAGTLTDSSLPDLVYTVTTPALIDAGTPITITFTSVTNPAAGDYVVTVTTKDGTDATIDTGTADVTITPLPLSFVVVAGTNDTVTAGVAFSVEITAKDEAGGAGATETGYTGDHMIDFTYTGSPTGTLPGFEVINFIAGVGTSTSSFILTDATEDDNTIIATDESSVVGESAVITINLPALDHFTITGEPASIVAGVGFTDVTVTAYDSLDNVKTDYVGTVSWSSTDPIAELPDDYTFIAGDNGAKTFDGTDDFILKTVLLEEGTPIDTTITVTGDGVSADASITVTPATASQWTVVAAPTSIRADNVNESTITATAYDSFDNVATGKAGTATFTTSLGSITGGGGISFSNGVATATLTSNGVVGTATVKVVDSVSLPYKTVTVTLMAPDLLAEVWVATTGNDADAGTEAAPFATIAAAITATATGGIVNVAAGTYSAAGTIDKQLTLKGANYGVSAVTGDRGPESIIDGGAVAVEISASGVILDGFMIAGDDGGSTYRVRNEPGSVTDGVQIRNNIIIPGANLGIFTWTGSGTASNWVISNNTVAADGSAIILRGGGTGNTISGNLIGAGGITISDTMANITIENNTISNTNDGGSGVSLAVDADGVTITGNTFSGELLNGNGVRIWSGATKVSTYAIHQNNFVSDFGAGSGFAVNNGTVDQVDATDNWWGHDSGPEHVLNPDGTGEPINGNVDFTPWLTAPYAEPVDPVDPVTTIDLVVGWNLISLPLYIPPENRAPATLLAGITGVDIVWGNYDPDDGSWNTYEPALPEEDNDLTAMRDGKGYWVDMTAAATLDVSDLGTELPEAPNAPPTYNVVVGWNLIGFKSTTAKQASSYLAAIDGKYTMIYGFADGAYFVVTTSDNLEPGYGYWIAVTEPGTIYP